MAEDGVNTKGIYFKLLRYDDRQKRPSSFLLKFETRPLYLFQNHPEKEEAFVLEGEVYFNEAKLSKGD